MHKSLWLLLLLIGVGAGLGGWFLHSSRKSDATANVDSTFLPETFGEIGPVSMTGSGERFEARAPFFNKGHRVIYVPAASYPGKANGTVYCLMIRLAPNVPHRIGSGMALNSTATGPELIIDPIQMDTNGKEIKFEYKVSGKPLQERFEAAGKTFDLSAGRLFLADLSIDPIRIDQVNHDLKGLVKGPDKPLTRENWEAVIGELAKKQAFRDFLPNTKYLSE
jgi:hypothetical protein